MANQDTESPGLVHVQIQLSQEAPKFKEKIRRATKRHELVEVDDFVFRRKRHAVALSPAVAAPAASELRAGSSPAQVAVKQGLQLDDTSLEALPEAAAKTQEDAAAITDQEQVPATAAELQAPLAAAAEQALQEEDPDQDAAGLAEAPATEAGTTDPDYVEQGPLQFAIAPSELCDLVEWVFFNERKKVPGTTADAARTAAAQFKEELAQLLHQHSAAKASVQQQETGGVTAAPQLTVLPYLLEQQKAALEDKRARLLQEEAHWLQLQQQYDDLDTTTAAPAAASEPVTADTTTPAECTAETSETPADAGAQPNTAQDAVVAARHADPEVGPVCAQQQSKIRSVQLKIEMLVALVSKMEHLVSSAESVARTLQAGYHNEKFKVFPHINSPAALIKSIVSSQQPPASQADTTAN